MAIADVFDIPVQEQVDLTDFFKGRNFVTVPEQETEEEERITPQVSGSISAADFDEVMRHILGVPGQQREGYEITGLNLTLEGVQALDKWIAEHQDMIALRQPIYANRTYPAGYCTPSRNGMLTGSRPGDVWRTGEYPSMESAWDRAIGQMPYRGFMDLSRAVARGWSGLAGGGIDE